MVEEVEIDARTLDVFAQQTCRVGLANGLLAPLDRLVELAADIVVADRRADTVARNRHALDQLVRVVTQDVSILAGPGLALVGVADDVLLAGHRARHEAPLQASREPCSAATTQRRELDLLDDVGRVRTLAQDLLPLHVSTELR